ncbi:MAG: hypothetical protein IKC09_09250 [Oscillospiraceae bacterium]|nr:hypothetical protein [Oscillospiraceae bacterium]
MTKIRWIALAMCVLMLALSLGGCFVSPAPTDPPTDPPTLPPTDPTPPPTDPPLTAETVLEKMKEAIDGRTPHQFHADLDMDMTMSVKADGFRFSVDMGMDLNVDILMNQEPMNMFMEMTMSLDSMGQQQVEQANLYFVSEDGKNVCYLYSPSMHMWQRVELEDSDQTGDGSSEPMELPACTLDEQTVSLDQRECYLLRMTLDEDFVSKFIKPITGSGIMPLSSTEEDPAEGARVEIAVYVDAETWLPVQMELDFLGIDDMINELIPEGSGLPGIELSMTAQPTADQSMGVQFSTFRLLLKDFGFDPVEVPEVPQEAFEYLVLYEHDPLQEDGSFLLVDLGSAVRVDMPDGWEAWEWDYNSLYLGNDVEERYAEIHLYPDQDKRSIVQSVVSDFISPLEDSGILKSYASDIMIWKYNTIVVRTWSEQTMYLAWGRTGRSWVVIYVVDYSGTSHSVNDILKPLIVSITEDKPVN